MSDTSVLVLLFGGLGLFLLFCVYQLFRLRDTPWTWDSNDPGWRRYELINQTKQVRVRGGVEINGKIVKPGADLSGEDLSGVDWGAGSPLFKQMEKALQQVNLSGANLSGANLRSLQLMYVNFTGANLTRTRFDGEPYNYHALNFTGANFTETDLKGKFTSCDFERATFTRVSLDGLSMKQCDFRGAVFRDIVTDGGRANSSFESCNFSDADLHSATLNSKLNFNGCRFDRTNLSRSHLSSRFDWCYFENADLSYTSGKISGSSHTWHEAKMIGSKLTGGDVPIQRYIPAPTIESQLEELAELLKNGTIDQAEHDALRRKILGI